MFRNRQIPPIGYAPQLPPIDYAPQPASQVRDAATQPHPHRVTSPQSRQKHPATFQCTLCPKRYTRAFSLRNHLWTHTDERPFVCTVCGKAFTRNHDRKTHEKLHDRGINFGFVCRGQLDDGRDWGCGRRFARKTALHRHFRSQRGKRCTGPMTEQRPKTTIPTDSGVLPQVRPLPGTVDANPYKMDFESQIRRQDAQLSSYSPYLPQALLKQYPALAQMNWGSPYSNSKVREDDIPSK